VAQKVSRYQLPNDQKIVLKPENEIRFIRHIKVSIKHYSIYYPLVFKYSVHDLLSDLNNYA